MFQTEAYMEKIMPALARNKVISSPLPVTLNINGVTTWEIRENDLQLFWYGNECSGLAYHKSSEGVYNVYPYYNGTILYDFSLYRYTDLHKPKTEEAFLEKYYKQALKLHQLCETVELPEGVKGSFEDYTLKFRRVLYWIDYYVSGRSIPKKR